MASCAQCVVGTSVKVAAFAVGWDEISRVAASMVVVIAFFIVGHSFSVIILCSCEIVYRDCGLVCWCGLFGGVIGIGWWDVVLFGWSVVLFVGCVVLFRWNVVLFVGCVVLFHWNVVLFGRCIVLLPFNKF